MIKKWKRGAQLLTTSVFIALYVAIGRLNSVTLRGGGEGEEKSQSKVTAIDPTAVKTIVGYSMEFKLREEMTDRITCEESAAAPDDATSSWRHDQNLQLHIYSAYYDLRLEPYRYVRVIGLLPRNSSFYCQIWYDGNEKQTFAIRKAVIHEIWSTNWGRKEDSCDEMYPSVVSCPIPAEEEYRDGIPVRVSFVDKSCNRSNVSVEIGRSGKRKPLQEFVVCVKALNYTSHINGQSLTEWIELNAKLGARKIIVYVTELDASDMKILRRYEAKDMVEVRKFESFNWTCRPRNYEEYLWRKRKMEIIAYNDCFYSNIHDAKFVIPLDIDEIIVPKIGNNWYEAFNSHFGIGAGERRKDKWPTAVDEYSSFSVRNAYFFARYPGDAIVRNLMLPNGGRNVSQHRKLVIALKRQQTHGPRDSIFNRIIRSSNFSPASDSIKSFVNVPKTLSVFNHYSFHVLGEATRQYVFPEDVIQLNHYRSSCDPVLIDGCHDYLNHITLDGSLEKFRDHSERS